MSSWNLVSPMEGDRNEPEFFETSRVAEKEVVGSVSKSSTSAKKIAVVTGMMISGAITPTYSLQTYTSNTSVVANSSQGREFEMERQVVYKDVYDLNKTYMDEKIKETNEKIDVLNNTLLDFINNKALTQDNLWKTLISGTFKKIVIALGGVATIWKFGEILLIVKNYFASK